MSGDPQGFPGASIHAAATSLKKDRLLGMLAKTGNLSLACQAAKLTRRQVRELRQVDEDFERSYGEAMDEAIDQLEAEAWRRALEGVEQPVLKDGKPVLDPVTNQPVIRRRYSDPLLVMLLRGSRPDKYQTRSAAAVPADPRAFIEEIGSDEDPPKRMA